jgi:hypothetical protein
MAKKKNPLIVSVIKKCRELDLVKSEVLGGVVLEIPYLNSEKLSGDYKFILDSLCQNYGVKKKDISMFYGRFQLWETGSFRKTFPAPNSLSKPTIEKSK